MTLDICCEKVHFTFFLSSISVELYYILLLCGVVKHAVRDTSGSVLDSDQRDLLHIHNSDLLRAIS